MPGPLKTSHKPDEDRPHAIPIVQVEDPVCNQHCVFCCSAGRPVKPLFSAISRAFAQSGESVFIGVWEPTLSPQLLFWVEKARELGKKTIGLRTNGIRLAEPGYARTLVRGGVTLFLVNFPSHLPPVCDAITGTQNLSAKRVGGIKNAIAACGKEAKTALIYVITVYNYRTMKGYVDFTAKEFPGISYISFNPVCQLGAAAVNRKLLVRFSDFTPYLRDALAQCRKKGIACIVDDVPLCFLDGAEEFSLDTATLARGAEVPGGQKHKTEACAKCSLAQLCPGPKDEYLRIFGDRELRPSRKNGSVVLDALARMDGLATRKTPAKSARGRRKDLSK